MDLKFSHGNFDVDEAIADATDLLLLGLAMPGRDGFQTAAELRVLSRGNTSFVAMSTSPKLLERVKQDSQFCDAMDKGSLVRNAKQV